MVQSRTPVQDPLDPATKIFVGGILLQVSSTEFVRYFATYGKVKNFILPVDPSNKALNLGYGFVNFKKKDSVTRLFREERHYLRAKEAS